MSVQTGDIPTRIFVSLTDEFLYLFAMVATDDAIWPHGMGGLYLGCVWGHVALVQNEVNLPSPTCNILCHVTDVSDVEERLRSIHLDYDDGDDGTDFCEDEIHCACRGGASCAGGAHHAPGGLVHGLGGCHGGDCGDGGRCTADRVTVQGLGVCDAAYAWERGECRRRGCGHY